MTKKEVWVIPEPCIVVYEMPSSAFSWASYHGISNILFLTQLFKMLEQQGVPYRVLRPYYKYQLDNRSDALADMLWNSNSAGGIIDAFKFAWLMKRFPVGLTKLFLAAMSSPNAPTLLRAFGKTVMRANRFIRRSNNH
jgi:hypothetical protein